MSNNTVVDTTGMSTTLSKNWTNPDVHLHIDHKEVLQLRDLRSFLTSEPWQLSLHNDGHGNDSVHAKRAGIVGARQSSHRLHPRTAGPAQQTSTTVSMDCNWRISMSFRGTKRICICAGTEMSTTSTRKLCTTLHNNGHVKNRSKSGT